MPRKPHKPSLPRPLREVEADVGRGQLGSFTLDAGLASARQADDMSAELPVKLWRFAAVIGGLALTGAVVGAVTGMCVAAVFLFVLQGFRGVLSGGAYPFAAAVGAACGSVLTPVASMAFMRHVPIWRLFAETAVGTLIGGVIGFQLSGHFYTAIGIAVSGFLLAGARLALVQKRASATTRTKFGRILEP